MAAPKLLRFLGMGNMSASDQSALAYDPPATPQDPAALAAAVAQLQNTVNELIKHFNAHTHSGVTTGAGSTGAVSETQTGAGATPQNLFTTS